MKYAFIFFSLVILPVIAYGFPHGGNSTVINAKTVTANLANTSYIIPVDFVGFSEEHSDVVLQSGQTGAPWTGMLFTGSNTSLINLIKLLGPNGLIRIGGNAQDLNSLPPLNSTIATNIEAFRAALGSGWKISYGLDLGINNTTDAVNQAGLILAATNNSNVTFSIGNEPDLYGISEAQYQTNWNAYYTALTAAYPSATFESPEISFLSNLSSYTNGLTPGVSGLKFVSGHYYPEFSQVTSIAQAISDARLSNFASYVSYAPAKFRVDETAAAYAEHVSGTVDRMMAACWYLNVASNLAKQGAIGISNHNAVLDGNTFTAPWIASAWVQQLDNGWGPSPIFDGMFLFSKIEGQTIVSTTNSGTGTVNSIATIGANGNANIIIINDDTINPVKVTPDQSTSWSTAKVLQIAASVDNAGCTDSNPKVGGSPIGESGVWAGGTSTINSGASVILGPCEAVLVQIQP